MKTVAIAALALLALPTTNHAAVDWQKYCKPVSETARQIMTLRQSGKDMSEMVDLAGTADPAIRKNVTQIVMAAYKQPRYQTDEMQQRAVADFTNDVYLKCAEDMGGG